MSTLYFDDFNGAAGTKLTDHVADTGQTYSITQYEGNPDNIQLNGASIVGDAVPNPGSQGCGFMTNEGLPVNNVTVTFALKGMIALPPGGYYLCGVFTGWGSSVGNNAIGCQFNADGSIEISDSTGNDLVIPAAWAPGNHNLVFQIGDSQEIVTLDGAVIATFAATLFDDVPLPMNFTASVYGAAAVPLGFLDSAKVEGASAPSGPPGFFGPGTITGGATGSDAPFTKFISVTNHRWLYNN